MTDQQSRRLTSLGRILVFGNLHPGDFPAGTKAAELLGIIQAAEADATAGSTHQASSGGAARAGTQTKAELFDGLYEDLRAINRTAKALATEVPGLEEKFRMPRSANNINLITAARAFLVDATPLAARFVEYEIPADFLTDLAADIAAFEAAEDDQGAGLTNRVGATRSVAEAILAGNAASRKLDPLMRNKYRYDPVKLAEWFTASRVEREARRKVAAEPTA